PCVNCRVQGSPASFRRGTVAAVHFISFNLRRGFDVEVFEAPHKMKLDRVLSVGQQSIFVSQQSSCGEHFASKKELITKLI
ncbi:MAG: hypothetical protein ACTS7E_04755, partial [Arsenophonus sp. NC-CH8-MAG3]